MKGELEKLTELLCGEELLSAYELHSSGLAPTLLQVLSAQPTGKYSMINFIYVNKLHIKIIHNTLKSKIIICTKYAISMIMKVELQ